MRAAGVEFKLSDLLAPSYQRTRRFLSGIINFAKYREEKFAKFEETDQEGERLEEEQLMAEDANQSAVGELACVRGEIAAEEPQMHELTTQLGSVNESMEHWKKELEQAKAQQQVLEKKMEEATRRSERMAGQIAELDKSKTTLVRRVIPDPEKELRTLEDLKARQMKEEELLAGAQRLRADRTTRRDHLEKSRKAVLKAVTLCQDISETLDHVTAERRAIKDYKTSIQTDENILRELDVNAGRFQTQLDSLKDRTVQAQSEQDKMKDEKVKQMEETRGRKMAAEREQGEVLAQLKELDLEIAKLETEEAALTRGHNERTTLTKSNILSVISQLRAYQSGIHSAMKETMQAQHEALMKQHQTDLAH
jgi:kinetochore protein Nuf2